MFCDPVFEADLPLIREAFKDALRERIAKIDRAEIDPAILRSNDKFAAALAELGVDPPTKVSLKTGKEAWAFAKSDEEFTALLDHEDERVATLVAARLAVKSTIGTTRALRLFRLGRTGPLAIALNIWGAGTDRWSGANKMNAQNFKRKSKLRRAMRAKPGYHVCVADSSNIEARGTAWFCQQDEMLQVFHDGKDPYDHMASVIFARPVDRKREEIHPETGLAYRPDEFEGFVGKQAVLGLGYGMQAQKFQSSCKVYKVHVDLELCVRTVNTYRTANYKVPAMWETLTHWSQLLTTGTAERFEMMGLTLDPPARRIWFPNGTSLYYPDAQMADDGREVYYRHRSAWKKLYGGKLLENIIQKYSRDIIADQILRIATRYRIGTMSHDDVCLGRSGPRSTARARLGPGADVRRPRLGARLAAQCRRFTRGVLQQMTDSMFSRRTPRHRGRPHARPGDDGYLALGADHLNWRLSVRSTASEHVRGPLRAVLHRAHRPRGRRKALLRNRSRHCQVVACAG